MEKLSIVDLPNDVLLAIFMHCDYKTLLTVAQVCKIFNRLSSHDDLWRPILARCLNIPPQFQSTYSLKDCCKISFKWVHGKYHETTMVKFCDKLLPWLQLNSSNLYVSNENCIQVYNHYRRQLKAARPVASIIVGEHDVTRFVVKKNLLVSGSKNYVTVWNMKDKSLSKLNTFLGHTKCVYCVDVFGNLILSGSRDRSIKIWSLSSGKCLTTTNIDDPVRSLAANPFLGRFVAGSAGYLPRNSALKLYDCETGHQLSELICDSTGRRGAGILDLKFESSNILLSCGYDTAVRLWDMRIGESCCVKKWEDPHDSAVYCIESDKKWMILSGTYRYGMVRLWDKRMDRCVKYYYGSRHTRSSVYSLKFNSTKLFVALDNRVNILNFD
ncbi:F-box/WD repeat-containing protein 4-like [Dendronephthya gigantea]|uniref:F-box/WD repeat-containing protein 4-like n=1 Tax=Dendronephthya gigantea TaxID=151771 RepID=UPI00106A7E1E|nr:F-box/WD repeat-containing protein 4-like [Dendronephthya gigantea]